MRHDPFSNISPYDSNVTAAIGALKSRLSELEGFSHSRPIQIGIDGFGDSSIDIDVRCWARTEFFHEVRYRCNQAIHAVLKQQGIAIPFPHLTLQEPVKIRNKLFLDLILTLGYSA